jgi:predicted DNA-binding protein (UPF0251 family)
VSATEKSSRPEGDDRYRVRSIERALDVLEALGDADSHGFRLAELARRLDTSKSTVLAALRTRGSAIRSSGRSTCSRSRCPRCGR